MKINKEMVKNEIELIVKDKIKNIKEKNPLVHNITNYVTVNDCANILLAIGASPIMSDDIDEVEEITSMCTSLNINIGTLNKRTIESMVVAGKKANELSHPVTLDPVGAGASKLRIETLKTLLKEVKFSVICGNITEIKSLISGENGGKGVDAELEDSVTEENIEKVIKTLKEYSKRIKSIIATTGAIDIITDGEETYIIRNGVPEMSKITGTGCMLTALIAAFVGANQEDKLKATVTAMSVMGIAGERALEKVDGVHGNLTMRNYIIDEIFNMTEERVQEKIRCEKYY